MQKLSIDFNLRDIVQIYNNIGEIVDKKSKSYEDILDKLDEYNSTGIKILEWNGYNYEFHKDNYKFWREENDREVREVFISELIKTKENCVVVVRF
jgi:hypothetical protein